ncbi:uncharacterized protein LOC129911377 isoform X2 [Episyrphus balteatus]|uniref:uncharacterized protein LOC129911377 isoform X2 n=1 Tax=Episyrphus balteatus TaxID=286459 RepID=UPI0024867CE4|nr:uncharacterized protein LOC129911377 isoform X2 [Episyrphus balteatus]
MLYMKSKTQSNHKISKSTTTATALKHLETTTRERGQNKAILMYISNNSGMATLLQQKNCMKTLTNGGGVSNPTNSNVSSSSGGSTVINGPSASINANGTNTIVTHHHIHNHHSGSIMNATTQQTRMLRPHEMVSIPIGSIVSTVGSGNGNGNGSGSATQGAFLVTGYQTTSHHHTNHHNNNHHSQPLTDLSVFTSSSQQHKITAAATTTASGTTTQTRYFSQFSNNHHQQHPHHQNELNSILYPVSTTSSGTNTVNRIVSSNLHSASSPAATANSNSNLHSNAYNTIVKQELHPPNSSSSNQLPHLQINQPAIKTEPQFDEQRVNGDKELQTFIPNGNLPSTNLPNGNATEQEVATPPAVIEEAEPEPEIDIVINNVVCSFSVRCHLNLREIALQGFNVEFRRENGMVTMKLRRPYTTASIWSSGRITCTGATSEDQAKIAARRYARCLQKLGFRVRFNNFRVVNVLGTCSMPFAIKIVNFSEKYKKEASYEPELHPGVTYKLRYPKATLKIFSTGSITVTAASVANVQAAIEHIFPLVYEFRKKRTPEELEILRLKQQQQQQQHHVEVDDTDAETVVHSPPSAKRKRRRNDGDNQEEDVDDPTTVTEPNATDDIIMVSEYDDPEDLIEGPDDEDDDL